MRTNRLKQKSLVLGNKLAIAQQKSQSKMIIPSLLKHVQQYVKGAAYTFFATHLVISQRKSKGRRFSPKVKEICLAVYFKSYKRLSKIFCLPSEQTLKKPLSKVSLQPGFNQTFVFLNLEEYVSFLLMK